MSIHRQRFNRHVHSHRGSVVFQRYVLMRIVEARNTVDFKVTPPPAENRESRESTTERNSGSACLLQGIA